MAITRGLVGRAQTLTNATEELAYDSRDTDQSGLVIPDHVIHVMRVRCTHASVGGFVRIPGIHNGLAVGTGTYLPPVDEIPAEVNGWNYVEFHIHGGIKQMFLSGDSAASSFEWGPVS